MATTTSTGTGPQPAGLAEGAIATVAGNGVAGFISDGGPGALTRVYNPTDVTVDKNGNLYIADQANHRIRKVTPNGNITTIAGDGTAGYISDGGPAVATRLYNPSSVAVDDAGNLYIADTSNHRIRKVTPNGIITTVAGNGTAGYVSDGGPAIATPLNSPYGVAVDRSGNLYIADYGNHRIRKVTPNGNITTIAGNGTAGYVSDGGPAIATRLYYPIGLTVDAAGNLYIADRHNHRIRKVTPNGIITTVAGNGTAGYVSDGGPALGTRLHYPWGVALDEAGNLYIGDGHNHRIRKVTSDGIITTIAGNGTAGYVDDGGPAAGTRLYYPYGIALDRAGNLYIADQSNQRIRGVTGVAQMTPPLPPAADLYGEVVSPYRVQRGQEFDLGARIRSRGPNPADGQHVTVVLTLADGLVGGPGSTGQRLTRTFTGQQLIPYQGSLDGVFRVIAPDTTPAGTYESTLEIQYGGDLNLKDNTYALPVTVVVPAPVADETALTIYQDTIPDVAPGQRSTFIMRYTSPAGQPVNPGTIVQRFTAPTAFVFAGQPTYAYYEALDGIVTGSLDYRIEDDGRTLIITANPHVNTTTSDSGSVIYTIPVQARINALPGQYDNGSASIGRHTPVQISGKITSKAQDETALRVVQASVPAAAPGQTAKFNLEFRSFDNQPVNPGTIEQRITAPTGFEFTGAASYGYYNTKPYVTGNLDTRLEDNGKTLVIQSNPHLNTGTTDKTSLIHTIVVKALPGATSGTQSTDGRAVIGRLAPVPLTGRIL
ncbi:NHL repeat-containing protein [Streptomyces eurocidicus]|uniref:Sugar lactone lactonase YvrE n=1 Tax=Streptomyces eurocidicus TaxID=66423 RepID=A0A7W8B9L4_STREU|nr:NHL repeat-containing protein [Streptomyces eurocidicus]MBB5118226.1 sugar lactone lactonase YvrE [Streptomyces eurocidicus]